MIYTRRFAQMTFVELRGEVDDVITSWTHREYTGNRKRSARMRSAGCALNPSSPTERFIKF